MDSNPTLRYVIGPVAGPVLLDLQDGSEVSPVSVATKVDRIPEIYSASLAGVALAFPTVPGVDYLDPVECRTYFVPVGNDLPKTVDAWLTSPFPFGIYQGPVAVQDAPQVVVPLPVGLVRSYFMVQTLLGFPS